MSWKDDSPWRRRVLVGCLVALTGQLYITLWAEGFRISSAAIFYPLLLFGLMRENHRPLTGLVTALCVISVRMIIALVQGEGLLLALGREVPGGVFYLVYDVLLCLMVRDRRAVKPAWLLFTLMVCDFGANLVNLGLSSRFSALFVPGELLGLELVAAARGSIVWGVMQASRSYRELLLRQEHEERYRRLFLVTAELKNELYFLKKNAEDIEAVMTNVYHLYESLPEEQEEARNLALGAARDVHEVKKDNLRIIRGLEQVVTESYDRETMALEDVVNILEHSTRQLLSAQRANIRLECHVEQGVSIAQHYPLLSVMKNLVTNAIEAIEGASGQGAVHLECRLQGEKLHLSVRDNGPGISERGLKNLFQVGYSTKFDPATGNINRGVGLPAVMYIVESLQGTIHVESEVGKGTAFLVTLPLTALQGGDV